MSHLKGIMKTLKFVFGILMVLGQPDDLDCPIQSMSVQMFVV